MIWDGFLNVWLSDTEICFCSFSVNLYKVTGQFPWSSLRETDRGISTEFSVRLLLFFSYLEYKRFPGSHSVMSPCLISSLGSFSVSYLEDEPHAEVGGSVEGARLSGTHSLLCRQRGERSLAEVLALRKPYNKLIIRVFIFWSNVNVLEFWLCQYFLPSMQWLLTHATPPSYLRKVPY